MRPQITARLLDIGLIPIVRVDSEETALRIAKALLEGGAQTAEITFTVPRATRVIESLRNEFPELLVGAGTILDAASARAAVDSGAQYLISAGLVTEMVTTAHRYGIPAIPGVLTPTEAIRALEAGADVLKLFPASTVGPAYLKALRGPLPQAVWCPTGGVSFDNLADWIDAGASLIGIGGPLQQDVARTGDFGALAERARLFMEEWHRLKSGR